MSTYTKKFALRGIVVALRSRKVKVFFSLIIINANNILSSQIKVRLGFAHRGITMSKIMIEDEKDDLAIAMPLAMMLGAMLGACLLLAHAVRKRRRTGGAPRRREMTAAAAVVVDERRQSVNDEESIATTMGVYNGIAGIVRLGTKSRGPGDDGERICLLENNNGTKYT